jgi:hypothetical protein
LTVKTPYHFQYRGKYRLGYDNNRAISDLLDFYGLQGDPYDVADELTRLLIFGGYALSETELSSAERSVVYREIFNIVYKDADKKHYRVTKITFFQLPV